MGSCLTSCCAALASLCGGGGSSGLSSADADAIRPNFGVASTEMISTPSKHSSSTAAGKTPFTPERGQPRCAIVVAEGTEKEKMRASRRVDGRYDVKGAGICVGTAALHQDQVYFEVEIVSLESDALLRVGVARKRKGVAVESLGNGKTAWCFECSAKGCNAGDTLGLAFDQVSFKPEIKVYKNGKVIEGADVRGIKGLVWPAVELLSNNDGKGGSVIVNVSCDAEGFKHPPPDGFGGIIAAKNIV